MNKLKVQLSSSSPVGAPSLGAAEEKEGASLGAAEEKEGTPLGAAKEKQGAPLGAAEEKEGSPLGADAQSTVAEKPVLSRIPVERKLNVKQPVECVEMIGPNVSKSPVPSLSSSSSSKHLPSPLGDGLSRPGATNSFVPTVSLRKIRSLSNL